MRCSKGASLSGPSGNRDRVPSGAAFPGRRRRSAGFRPSRPGARPMSSGSLPGTASGTRSSSGSRSAWASHPGCPTCQAVACWVCRRRPPGGASPQRVRTAGWPRRMLASGAVIVFRWGCVSRLRASACVLGGAPRPELSTMTPRSVRRVVRGGSEASVSMSGRRTEGLAHCGGATRRWRSRPDSPGTSPQAPPAHPNGAIRRRERARACIGCCWRIGVVCGEHHPGITPHKGQKSRDRETKTPGR